MERIETGRIHASHCPLRDNLGDIYGLAKSIEERGLLQPIIVKPSDGRSFEVIAGNRRLAACKLIKWKNMPCYIVNFDDREALEVSIIENVQHESLNYIEEAKAFKRYVEERGYGAISELARKIGKSPSYVSRRISILELPKHLQEELLRCRKTSSIAQELISMDGDYTEEISRLILGTNITSSQVRKIIKKIKEKGAEYDEDTTLLFKSSLDDKRDRMVERVLTKCIASFRLCMMRFDEALDYLDKDEWVLWNELMQYRSFTHQQIDNLLRLERKMKKAHHFN